MTIRTPTTFVIGAGASCAWGLPTGKTLKKLVAELPTESEACQFIFSALHPQIGPAEVNHVRADLIAHPEDSIDSFLEKQRSKPNILRIGKMLMAGVLADSTLKAQDRIPENQDWLGHVLRRMLYGVPDCSAFLARNAKVQFVTFNFDRFIERQISEIIGSSGMAGDLGSVIDSLPVFHVHGTLPHFPNCPLKYDDFFHRNAEWVPWLKAAAEAIHVTSDEINDESLEPARKAVKEAAVLCFLGFGYSSDNLSRLTLPSAIQNRPDPPEVFGSAFGLGPAACAGAQDRLGVKASLGDTNKNCREVLDHLYVIREH